MTTAVVPMPCSPASSAARWYIAVLARSTAFIIMLLIFPGLMFSLYPLFKSPSIRSTAMALAMLPPLAPPMPSQTTAQAPPPGNSPQLQASWFELRTAPVSVAKSTFITVPSFMFSAKLPAGSLDICSKCPSDRGRAPAAL